jgi:excisionase family DNA binding protein
VNAAASDWTLAHQRSRKMNRCIGYSPEEASKLVSMGRTKIFQEIKDGRLKARKMGRKTIILDDDLREYARNLPEREISSAAKSTGEAA